MLYFCLWSLFLQIYLFDLFWIRSWISVRCVYIFKYISCISVCMWCLFLQIYLCDQFCYISCVSVRYVLMFISSNIFMPSSSRKMLYLCSLYLCIPIYLCDLLCLRRCISVRCVYFIKYICVIYFALDIVFVVFICWNMFVRSTLP